MSWWVNRSIMLGGNRSRGGHHVWFGITTKTPNGTDALQEALTQLENTMRERDAYLQQRDIAIGERNLALAEIERLKRQV